MEETKLRQLFKNSADAYLDTIDDSVEQGMSEDCFIKAIKQAFSLNGVSQHRELLIAFKEHLDNRDEKGYFITEYVIDEFIESNL